MPTALHIANMVRSCRTLGPGARGVIWVTGCSRRCPGCIADPILEHGSGQPLSIEQLAADILTWPGIDGLTFSGGEPFEQAGTLADLCEAIRHRRDMSLMSYTGYTLAELQRSRNPDHHRLLSYLDILVDGPFVEGKHSNVLWRGSSNQRIHLLTPRHADLADQLAGAGVGVEIYVRRDNSVFWAGIPEPGFQERLEQGLRSYGVSLAETNRMWS